MPTNPLSALIERKSGQFVPQMDNRLPTSLLVRIGAPINATIDIDLKHAITTAVAQKLWEQHGGNSVVNWLQAEAIVDNLNLNPGSPPAAQPIAEAKPDRKARSEPRPIASSAAA